MNFETAEETAKRLGVTVRAVQKWAKEGKIPSAEKKSGVWMIPASFSYAADVTVPEEYLYKEPMPIINSFEDGEPLAEFVGSFEDEDVKNIALLEYYYFTGDFEKCSAQAELYLTSKYRILRSTAALFCMFSNLCAGHLIKAYYAESILDEELSEAQNRLDMQNRAPYVFASAIETMQLHLPSENAPEICEYVKFYSGGVKLMSLYLMAYTCYHRKEYERALGIVDSALVVSPKKHVIPMIYLYIVGAMANINLLNKKKAEEYIEKAWRLSEKNKLIMPFVEHFSLLQGFIDKKIKKEHPESYREIVSLAKRFNESWYKIYNEKNVHKVAENLTHTEFTVAMLYSRNWRVKEIAEHLELSERTINNYISVIYDKLGINNKKLLEKFMLR